jgi:uncharacterized protein YuzE
MKGRYLEITFRRGRPLAAYLYLPRGPGVKSARTEKLAEGVLVDYAADGKPIGLEILDPGHVQVAGINEALTALGFDPLDAEELAPLVAA